MSLVLGVRPGIAWRLGHQTLPADVLDDDGIAGWSVGLSSLQRTMAEYSPAGADHPATAELSTLRRWIDLELQRERKRWLTPATMVRSFRLVVLAGESSNSRTLARWADNVAAAARRATSGDADRPHSLQRHLEYLRTALPDNKTGHRCQRSLDQLKGPTPDPRDGLRERDTWLPLLPKADRADMRGWIQRVSR